jgi:ABC-type multidrug transport system ATPase subunit
MIQFRGTSFSYRRGETVIANLDLEIGPGLTLLLGENGCGKSTLLKLAAGIEAPDAGTVEIAGHDLWREEVAARRDLAYVAEQPDLTPFATIREILELVCRLRGVPIAQVQEAMARAALPASLAHRSVRELSPRPASERPATPCSTNRSKPWTAPRAARFWNGSASCSTRKPR